MRIKINNLPTMAKTLEFNKAENIFSSTHAHSLLRVIPYMPLVWCEYQTIALFLNSDATIYHETTYIGKCNSIIPYLSIAANEVATAILLYCTKKSSFTFTMTTFIAIKFYLIFSILLISDECRGYSLFTVIELIVLVITIFASFIAKLLVTILSRLLRKHNASKSS